MFLLFLVLLATFSLILLKYLAQKKYYQKCLKGMPQPPAYPIVGNLFDVLKSPVDLFDYHHKLAIKYYPIYKLEVCHLTLVNIMAPQDMEIILSNMAHNTKSVIYKTLHSWLGEGLLTSTGAKWQKRRKLLTPAFHFSILQEFIQVFAKEADTLIKDLESECHKPFINILEPISEFTLSSIGATAMGISLKKIKENKNNYKEAVHQVGQLAINRLKKPWLTYDFIYFWTKARREEKRLLQVLHSFTDSVITKRREDLLRSSYSSRKRLALLDLLLKHESEEASIDAIGIREEVDTFMFEGYDTTSMAICFGLMCLANNRQIQDEIYKEIQTVLSSDHLSYSNLQNLNLMERCIKEILRLYPSVPFISRIAGFDTTTSTGYTIPKGCIIYLSIFDLHRDANIYPDPEKFDPDRFLPENTKARHPFAYIPFSAGPRNCIGQKFGMLEMKTVFVGILKRFILEPIDTPKDVAFIKDLVLRAQRPIRVKFTPRNLN